MVGVGEVDELARRPELIGSPLVVRRAQGVLEEHRHRRTDRRAFGLSIVHGEHPRRRRGQDGSVGLAQCRQKRSGPRLVVSLPPRPRRVAEARIL